MKHAVSLSLCVFAMLTLVFPVYTTASASAHEEHALSLERGDPVLDESIEDRSTTAPESIRVGCTYTSTTSWRFNLFTRQFVVIPGLCQVECTSLNSDGTYTVRVWFANVDDLTCLLANID